MRAFYLCSSRNGLFTNTIQGGFTWKKQGQQVLDKCLFWQKSRGRNIMYGSWGHSYRSSIWHIVFCNIFPHLTHIDNRVISGIYKMLGRHFVSVFMIVISSKNIIMSIDFDADTPRWYSVQSIVFRDYTGNAHWMESSGHFTRPLHMNLC